MHHQANQKDYGYYGPDSMAWKIGRETAVLLGGGRAVLMDSTSTDRNGSERA